MALHPRSGSLDPVAVSAYLTQRTPSSVLYALSLQQPLTLKELQGNPLRLQYLETLTGREAKGANLRKVVSRGVDLGLLVPSTARREYYYFLNSDVQVRAPALTEHDGQPSIALDETWGAPSGEISLPPRRTLGSGHPIPRFRDPSAPLAWFHWLTDPRRREILWAIQERGPLSRHELATTNGGLPMETAKAGLRCGVLRLHGDAIDFPFARTTLPSGAVWTARPPRFWFTRSYEPLRCLQRWEDYVDAESGTSPMKALTEIVADGRKVLPRRRRRHLSLNVLYEASATIPSLQDVGPATLPSVWENRRGWVYPVEEGAQRAEAALALKRELELDVLPEGEDLTPAALTRLAERRVGAYLRRRENELIRRHQGGPQGGFGLGADAILSLASEELERGRILEERKYFEAFLEALRGEA
ncbi:MAG: hypothetical protein ACE5JE_05155 [Thermoplasmata archaeon]